MSAKNFPALLCGIFLLLAGAAHAELSYKSENVTDANAFVMTVQYAYEDEDIKFVVFHRNHQEAGLKCLVAYEANAGGRNKPLRATITLNDKTEVDLLKAGGIYRVDDGLVQKIDLKFKTSDLKKFLNENRWNITADAFIVYLKKKKA